MRTAGAGVDDVAETVRFLGGVATWRLLRVVHPARLIRRATTAGVVVRPGRGRYVLPSASEHLRLSQSRGAALSHLSAALHHGWAVKTVPEPPGSPCAATGTSGRASSSASSRAGPNLRPDDVAPRRHDPAAHRARLRPGLPFDEALAVADSALRARALDARRLAAAAAGLRGTGARRARRVAAHADGRAANPFESVLRALTIEEGFDLTPQLQIADSGLFAIVDLGSEELRLAVEADGFEHHGTRKGLRKDCRRHTEFAVFGWSSLRFSFEDVMYEQPGCAGRCARGATCARAGTRDPSPALPVTCSRMPRAGIQRIVSRARPGPRPLPVERHRATQGTGGGLGGQGISVRSTGWPSAPTTSTGTTFATTGRSARKAAAESNPASCSSDTTVGGSIRTSPAACRSSRSRGRTHALWSDSVVVPVASWSAGIPAARIHVS